MNISHANSGYGRLRLLGSTLQHWLHISTNSLNPSSDTETWLRCISLASLGSDTVVPAGDGVLDEASQVVEQLREGHLAGLVDSVVQQGSTPKGRVFPEQDTVDAGEALFCGVLGLQIVLLPAHVAAPWLVAVVDTAEIMRAWWIKTRTNYIVGFYFRILLLATSI